MARQPNWSRNCMVKHNHMTCMRLHDMHTHLGISRTSSWRHIGGFPTSMSLEIKYSCLVCIAVPIPVKLQYGVKGLFIRPSSLTPRFEPLARHQLACPLLRNWSDLFFHSGFSRGAYQVRVLAAMIETVCIAISAISFVNVRFCVVG